MSTIHDVARRADVGVGTVSRFLNGTPVRPATAARIEAAISELGFVANRAARGLARGRIPTIAVLVPFVTQPSTFERVRGIIESARGTGLPVSLYDVERPEHLEDHLRALCGDLRPEALVIVSLQITDEQCSWLEAASLRPVFLDAYSPDHPSVTIDDELGGHLGTSHLLDLGHRRIAFLGDEESTDLQFTSSARRRRGYRSAMTEAGLAVREGYESLGRHGADPAAAQARELLSLPEPPTAIVAASDTQALGALRAARERGLRVPEDLSVLGFDDIETAEYAGLSTVRQPLRAMSAQVLEMVGTLMAGGDVEPPHHVAELTLVTRGTTGPAPV